MRVNILSQVLWIMNYIQCAWISAINQSAWLSINSIIVFLTFFIFQSETNQCQICLCFRLCVDIFHYHFYWHRIVIAQRNNTLSRVPVFFNEKLELQFFAHLRPNNFRKGTLRHQICNFLSKYFIFVFVALPESVVSEKTIQSSK